MLFLWASIVPLIVADGQAACPVGTHILNDQQCLAPLSVDSFYQAELTCLQLGGHLPSVPDPNTNDQLILLGNKYFQNCGSMWIGLDARSTWLNGDNHNYFNGLDPTGDSYGVNCVSLSFDNGNWSWVNCSLPQPYMCSFIPSFDPTQTDTPMPTCGVFQNATIGYDPSSTNKVHCTISTHTSDCNSWSIVVFIGLKTNQTKDQLTKKKNYIWSYLNSTIQFCPGQSQLLIFTPWMPDCNPSSVHELGTTFDNLNESGFTFQSSSDEDSEILGMFQQFENCPTFTLPKNFAGMIYFFSDLVCDDVCTETMFAQQRYLIDNMTAAQYNIRFIRIGDDSVEKVECFKQAFDRCGQYGDAICAITGYDDLTTAVSDSNGHFCPLTADVITTSTTPSSAGDSFSTAWIIVSSVVAFLIIVACVGIRCFFRYKALKQGNKWSWFVWKSPEDGGVPTVSNGKTPSAPPNEYGELPREPDLWEILPENLFFGEQDILGSGAFATVYLGHLKGEIPLSQMNKGALNLGIRKDADGTFKVAVKRLPPHASAEGRSDFNHEIEFMKELGYHPHVLSLLGVVNATHDKLIVIENCEHGDLLTYIRSKKETFVTTEPETIDFFSPVLRVKDLISIAWQVSDGMSYLASRNFIHRDIAARNILMTKSMVAKIGDFGLCRLVDSSLYTAKGGRLPIKWMAPESLKYYEYSLKSDIWSFGVLLFELFSLGEAPYGTVQPSEMPKFLDEGNRLPQSDTCPNEIYKIMTKCWEKMSEDRPTIDQIREELTSLLNNDSSSYGYLSIHDIDNTEVCEV